MKANKTYKIIVPYTESAAPYKKFKIEYVVNAENRTEAKQKAEQDFDKYSQKQFPHFIDNRTFSNGQ